MHDHIYCKPFEFIRFCPASGRVSPFIGFLKHREQQLARRRENLDAVCSGYWRGGYEISLEGEEDEVLHLTARWADSCSTAIVVLT